MVVSNKSTKVFLAIMSLFVLSVVGYRWYSYINLQDYSLVTEVECNEDEKKDCFVYISEEGEYIYKKIYVSANDAPNCFEEHACVFNSCLEISNPNSCTEEYCSIGNLKEGELCYRDL